MHTVAALVWWADRRTVAREKIPVGARRERILTDDDGLRHEVNFGKERREVGAHDAEEVCALGVETIASLGAGGRGLVLIVIMIHALPLSIPDGLITNPCESLFYCSSSLVGTVFICRRTPVWEAVPSQL